MKRIAGAIMLFGGTIGTIMAELPNFHPNPPVHFVVVVLIIVQIVGGLSFVFKGEAVQVLMTPEEPEESTGQSKRMPPDER